MHKILYTVYIKNGYVRDKRSYRCKECRYNFIEGDNRSNYDNKTKNLVIRMYLNNCGLRRIAAILGVLRFEIRRGIISVIKRRWREYDKKILKTYIIIIAKNDIFVEKSESEGSKLWERDSYPTIHQTGKMYPQNKIYWKRMWRVLLIRVT